MHVRPKNDASNGVFKKGRGAQHAAETKNKSERREVGKNKGRKEGRGKDQKEGEMLYYRSTQLVNFAFSFSLYVRSTDLRVVSMTCDLRAEQRKRDRGKKYERREEQWIRSATWVNYDARGALIEIEAACISLFRFALPPTAVPPFSEL